MWHVIVCGDVVHRFAGGNPRKDVVNSDPEFSQRRLTEVDLRIDSEIGAVSPRNPELTDEAIPIVDMSKVLANDLAERRLAVAYDDESVVIKSLVVLPEISQNLRPVGLEPVACQRVLNSDLRPDLFERRPYSSGRDAGLCEGTDDPRLSEPDERDCIAAPRPADGDECGLAVS